MFFFICRTIYDNFEGVGFCGSDENEECELSDEQQPEMTSEAKPEIQFGPHRKLSRKDELHDMKEEFTMIEERKFVCSIQLLLGIFQGRCQTPGCTSSPNVEYHCVGTVLIVKSLCPSGHAHRFCSSHKVNDIYVNNLQAAASIILSGNHFAKIERMANFLSLGFLSKSTYYRFQRLYLIPEINDCWFWMRSQSLPEFTGKDIVVGGDGQCDSPGFNAKNLCYFIMEVESDYILDIEVLDKRHVGLISTNMEKEAVERSLDWLNQDLKVVELVTDASTSVKALLGEFSLRILYLSQRPILYGS